MDDTSSSPIKVIGHEWAIELLTRQAQAGRVPQSILLSGPLNVGKSTVARFFAQFLNCQAEAKPCGHCISCRKIVSGNHPDVRLLDDDGPLKIEEIRALQRDLFLSPYEGPYRLALLCNFERATISAANALLKTLEEPASMVVLILTAIEPGALLPTIVSRCQLLALRPLPRQPIVEVLQSDWHASADQATLLARLCAGRLGWAVRALEDKRILEYRQACLQDLFDLLTMNRVERLAYAQRLSRDPVALKDTLMIWLSLWRDLLLLRSGSRTNILNLDWQDSLQHIVPQGNITQAKEMIERLQRAILNFDYKVNPRLNLETVLLRLPRYLYKV